MNNNHQKKPEIQYAPKPPPIIESPITENPFRKWVVALIKTPLGVRLILLIIILVGGFSASTITNVRTNQPSQELLSVNTLPEEAVVDDTIPIQEEPANIPGSHRVAQFGVSVTFWHPEKINPDDLTGSFREIIKTELHPYLYGFGPQPTGNPLVDAISAIKLSVAPPPGITREQAVAQMAAAAGWLKDQAVLDPAVEEVRVYLFKEFSLAANNPENLKVNSSADLNALSYYTEGMRLLAVNAPEVVETNNTLTAIAEAIAAQYQALQEQPAAVEQEQPAIVPAPAPQSLPDVSEQDAPQPNIQPLPETSPIGQNIQPIEITFPEINIGNTLPPLLLPYQDLFGIAWSPEQIVRMVQRLAELFTSGAIPTQSGWVVVNVSQLAIPVQHWLVTIIDYNTLQSQWNDVPRDCRIFLSDRIKDPSLETTENWTGYISCTNYFAVVYGNLDQPEKLVHTNEEGIVDFMGISIIFPGSSNPPFSIGQGIGIQDFADVIDSLLP